MSCSNLWNEREVQRTERVKKKDRERERGNRGEGDVKEIKQKQEVKTTRMEERKGKDGGEVTKRNGEKQIAERDKRKI